MGNPIWKGTTEIQERPDSPEIVESNTDLTITQRFEGPYSAIIAARPKVGTPMKGFANVPVESSRVAKLPGRRGLLTITGKVASNTLDGSPLPIGEPILEIDWVRISKPIESHDFFANLDSNTVARIKKAAQEGEQSPSLPSPAAIKLYEKLLRGQDSYDVWAPVVRRISTYYGRPQTGDCGMRSAPPFSPSSAWQYLKTGDTSRRENRRWTQTEEWMGAHEIDSDIYR